LGRNRRLRHEKQHEHLRAEYPKDHLASSAYAVLVQPRFSSDRRRVTFRISRAAARTQATLSGGTGRHRRMPRFPVPKFDAGQHSILQVTNRVRLDRAVPMRPGKEQDLPASPGLRQRSRRGEDYGRRGKAFPPFVRVSHLLAVVSANASTSRKFPRVSCQSSGPTRQADRAAWPQARRATMLPIEPESKTAVAPIRAKVMLACPSMPWTRALCSALLGNISAALGARKLLRLVWPGRRLRQAVAMQLNGES
jgi:hypothetical protein